MAGSAAHDVSRARQLGVAFRTSGGFSVLDVIAATDLAADIVRADARLWAAWFEAVAELPGNPHGIETTRAGDAVALRTSSTADPYYNRVMGLGTKDADRLPEIADFFGGGAFRVDMSPFAADDRLTSELLRHRLNPAGFQTSLYVELGERPRESRPTGVLTRAVRPHEIAFFARLFTRSYFDGRRLPQPLMRFREDTVVARFGRPGWRHYLALVDGVPAGGALMHVDGDVATLAGAATTPTMRRRGVQAALLSSRLEDAAAEGCRLAVSRCGVGSPSQRNMERAGLVTAYTKVVWVRAPGPGA